MIPQAWVYIIGAPSSSEIRYRFSIGAAVESQGHAHPAIVEAIQKRAPLGTQFGLPTEDAIVMASTSPARSSCRSGASSTRAPRPRWTPSASPAASPVVSPSSRCSARYHGHHDYVMVSIGVKDFGAIGPRDDYKSISYGAGIPKSSLELTVPVPFNDIENMTKRIERMVAEGNPRPPSSWSPP